MAESLEKAVERLQAVNEIQNVLAKHMHFHTTGKHWEELDTIWAKKTPGVCFAQNDRYYVGTESVRKTYGEFHDRKCQGDLEKLKKHFPKVEVKPENYAMGTYVVHPLTSPCIEIAGDGQTAKGVWYSPGQITEIGADGKPFANWMWEKYGVDFVKEDGKWYIWHLHMYYDFAVPVGGKSWAELAMEGASKKKEDTGEAPSFMPEPDLIAGETYKGFGPTNVPKLLPRLPEPYRTFSETFSYGPPATV
jgi:hypothetical protein